MSEPKPKIIVDDDWKSKVEAEKQIAQEQLEHLPPESEMRMPAASFTVLIRTLATQALVALGQIPDPYTGQAVADLDVAKHFIDTLAILEEKTRGNLGNDEKAMLEDILHQLRLGFVAMQQAVQAHLAGSGEVTQGGIQLP